MAGLLLLGVTIMTASHQNNILRDNPNIVAQKALADFLQQPIAGIACKSVSGGSEEGAIVQCTHLGTNYIVKFFSSSEFGNNEIALTQHASDLGIGPKLYYTDQAQRYMIIEFAKGNSLVPATANTPTIIKNIATSLTKLHKSHAPFVHPSYMFTRIDAKYKNLHCSGALKDILEKRLQLVKKIEDQFQNFPVSLVPCHNDLNPGNVFVHNNQVILIDWGDAALGSPYFDIAAFLILNAISAENEKLFFKHYDSKLLTPQWQTYMLLNKQLVYFEFALNLLGGAQAGNQKLLHTQVTPLVNNIDYYLTLFAKREAKIGSAFLYHMALSSLNEMTLNV